MNHVGGAIARRPDESASYPHRKAGFVLAIHGVVLNRAKAQSDGGATDEAIERWTQRTYQGLKPFFSGAFVNYNDPDLEDWQEMYYGKNYKRLRQLKEDVGGHWVFSTAQRI